MNEPPSTMKKAASSLLRTNVAMPVRTRPAYAACQSQMFQNTVGDSGIVDTSETYVLL